MSDMVINIPKSVILRAVMGNGSYKETGQLRKFDEPRNKERYYYTKNRLTRAQIQVLLEMHRQTMSDGFAYDVRIRDIADKTHLTMQCVNKCIKFLDEKGFIVIGLKDYGYVNYFINLEQGYSEENNTGGYYQMDYGLLDYLLSIDKIDDLRLALIGILEDDFARVKAQQPFISQTSIRKIIPSSAHPKACQEILQTEKDAPFKYEKSKRGVIFILKDEYYGKYTTNQLATRGKELIKELSSKGLELSKKNERDIVALCQEFGHEVVKVAVYSIPVNEIKSAAPLGVILRGIITNFISKPAC